MNEGEKIRALRGLRGYKQAYLASQLKISTKAYSKLESGQTQLTVCRLREISQILKVNPVKIIYSDVQQSFEDHIQHEDKINCLTQDERCLYNQQIQYLREEVAFLRSLLKESPTLKADEETNSQSFTELDSHS